MDDGKSRRSAPAGESPPALAGASPRPDVVNLATARFDCVYPTCGGLCCMNGHPPVEVDEEQRIRANMDKFAPHLRPDARAMIAQHGFLAPPAAGGRPTIAVSKGWCVFFQDGCVLQKVGEAEGERYRYKPWRCVLFPLKRKPEGGWYVRQRGLNGERWDLFCLNPEETTKTADTTLREEVAHLRKLAAEGREPGAPKPR